MKYEVGDKVEIEVPSFMRPHRYKIEEVDTSRVYPYKVSGSWWPEDSLKLIEKRGEGMSKQLSLNDFKDDGTGYKYEIKPGDSVDIYLDFETSNLLRENATLKAQRDELLLAMRKIGGWLEYESVDSMLTGKEDTFKEHRDLVINTIEHCK